MINEIVFMIVVIFSGLNADGTKNMYVFAKPFYEEEVHCQADITDPAVYPGLIANLVKDYKGMPPGTIESVQCVRSDEVIDAVEKSQGVSI
tara:strand:+ start:69 stop:341 length:273 start_codon:yes stop_codon:yes gene_type:complete